MSLLRRRFLVVIAALASAAAAVLLIPRRYVKRFLLRVEAVLTPRNGVRVAPDQVSDIFIAKNGSPQENVAKVIEMMGGVERFVGVNDIVILKPNAQWWNQGRTNLAAMKGFIDLVLGIPGFGGEVIIGENHHFMDDSLPEAEKDNVRGWTELGEINNDIDGIPHTLDSLVRLFQEKGHRNVTRSHWRDGGPKADVWGNGQNGGIVASPADGDGYVWTDEEYVLEGLWGLRSWRVKMTYPIFTSAYSGITIDFKNGAYLRDGESGGRYLEDLPVKFVNFSVLNTHGSDTGTTAAIKNYMGVTDLSCGSWGLEPEGFVNVHECGAGLYPFAKAGPLGHFLKTIRAADLNIVTAEWVGWGSRTDVSLATRMRTILAGTDPVALDYYGAKHLVYPLSRNAEYHDPDNPRSAVARFLHLAQQAWGQGVLDEARMRVHEHAFPSG